MPPEQSQGGVINGHWTNVGKVKAVCCECSWAMFGHVSRGTKRPSGDAAHFTEGDGRRWSGR